MLKRAVDLLAATFGLILLGPLFAVIALFIIVDSPGPVFFRQERVGRAGRCFRIHKFRTMQVREGTNGPSLTIGADPRITPVGAVLRRYKLDELPQLIDVLYGEMSLVGPRPEVLAYVAHYPEADRDLILSVRPGITDLASLEFSDESTILGQVADPKRYYLEVLLPRKLAYYRTYVDSHSVVGDFRIIFATILKVFFGVRPAANVQRLHK